ncbi:cytochrome-c oxidase, cbb3-type subunit III [Basilea psittacipulmonis]|uniref:Cbb3-type cytochrome c oxidase subunit n=1 Tax=Basilea psittacipulmonis DSM 24701 TaxID=1072685 RepID=A0A077DFZ7_9BURK|nr:cytochrome-c oxidase, cbb3-type subunit III [Basilea psittacipulmonis]AIL32342.1 cytochrome oxidase subunit III [Basilea psittacipulmonis DSM 24701]
MSEFVSAGWSYWVAIVSILGIVFCLWLLWTQRSFLKDKTLEVSDTGHEWDGIKELNSPVPRWWTLMYLGLCVIGVIIIVLYPALGSDKGLRNWTSFGEVEQEKAEYEQRIAKVYQQFDGKSLDEIVRDPAAQRIGERLFLNNCSQCHGSDAKGSPNFPNLTDNDWLWGGSPETILNTITNGRHGIMAPLKAVFSKAEAEQVADYVRSLSGLPVADKANIPLGEANFKKVCAACHGMDAKGNQLLGAPNLTDGVWLNSPKRETIVHTILDGRQGVMPAWKSRFTKEQIEMLTAYVWGLSNSSN